MKKINYTLITFDLRLRSQELTSFRGAVAKKTMEWANNTDFPHDLFHNHGTDESISSKIYIHRYPLIQYHIYRGKACILGLDMGAIALQTFANKFDGYLNIQNLYCKTNIISVENNEFLLQFEQKIYRYKLTNWLALNSKNYEDWKKIASLIGKIELLQKNLTNHLVSFGKGFDWKPVERFEPEITHFYPNHIRTYRDIKFVSIDIDYQINIQLPNRIGLGKSVSEGFGRNILMKD